MALMWHQLARGALAASLAAGLTWACTTLVRTTQVEMSVGVACEDWPESGGEGLFSVEVIRSTLLIGANNAPVTVACHHDLEEAIPCDSTVSKVLEIAYMPEIYGVKVTSSQGEEGYYVGELFSAGQVDVSMLPGDAQLTDRDQCREVMICLKGYDTAVQDCAALAQYLYEGWLETSASPTPWPADKPLLSSIDDGRMP